MSGRMNMRVFPRRRTNINQKGVERNRDENNRIFKDSSGSGQCKYILDIAGDLSVEMASLQIAQFNIVKN